MESALKSNKFMILSAVILLICFCAAPLWMYSLFLITLFGMIDIITLFTPVIFTLICGFYVYSFIKKDYQKLLKYIIPAIFLFMTGLVNIEQMIAGYDYIMGGFYAITILLILLFKNKNDVRFYLIPLSLLILYLFRYYWLL